MSISFTLAGKCALVTGGGTGIGLAISRAFVDAGATVVITGRREDVLREACQGLGSSSDFRACDVSDKAKLPGLVQELEKSGPIDILVNNAGINMKKPVAEVSDEDFSKIIETNLNGLFSLTGEVAKYMTARKARGNFEYHVDGGAVRAAESRGIYVVEDGRARTDAGAGE